MIKDFSELIVWQKAMDLVVETYQLVSKLPNEEKYALSDQMRRAAVSIPSNIAEGQARNSKKEFVNYLAIARGSNAELRTQYAICGRLQYLTETDMTKVCLRSDEVGKMLNSLIQRLATSH
jgi:four helix bundle protein